MKSFNIPQLKADALLGKRVLIRVDVNVPIKDGVIQSHARIHAVLPTLFFLKKHALQVLIMSHLGRPKEGEINNSLSLAPVADYLSQCLETYVPLVSSYLDGHFLANDDVVMLENVRFNEGETKNDEKLSKQYASLCDIFVMDAFGSAHRKHASTYGVAVYANETFMGFLLEQELSALDKGFSNPQNPVLAIIGGSKIKGKIALLYKLIDKVDVLALGGGMANTFLAAKNVIVGRSLFESDMAGEAIEIEKYAKKKGKTILLPQDAVVFCGDSTASFSQENISTKDNDSLLAEDNILDIGPKTQKKYNEAIQMANTIIWNGPVGLFEAEYFSHGTSFIANAIAESKAYSFVGGGDTVSALEKNGNSDRISYVSSGGGALLELMEGKMLPGLEVLQRSCEKTL